MAAVANTIKAEDLVKALDVEFNNNFKQEFDLLGDVLGIVSPEIVAAGTALYQYKVTGSLSTAEVAEGDVVPLSKYSVEKVPVGEVGARPYRSATTYQAILKSGYNNAIVRTDAKMMKDVRANIIDAFFGFLKGGTGAARGETLQMALAQADAELDAAMEANGDHPGRVVHFVNRFDVADYLGSHEVTTQSVFGMVYLQSYLGIQDVFVTNKVARGRVFVTPSDNLHLYGVDFGALSQAGITYTSTAGSLIGVHHSVDYTRVCAETNVLTGATLLAEVTDYIVRARVGKAMADMTVEELKALASAEGVDITGKTTKDDISAALAAAGVR